MEGVATASKCRSPRSSGDSGSGARRGTGRVCRRRASRHRDRGARGGAVNAGDPASPSTRCTPVRVGDHPPRDRRGDADVRGEPRHLCLGRIPAGPRRRGSAGRDHPGTVGDRIPGPHADADPDTNADAGADAVGPGVVAGDRRRGRCGSAGARRGAHSRGRCRHGILAGSSTLTRNVNGPRTSCRGRPRLSSGILRRSGARPPRPPAASRARPCGGPTALPRRRRHRGRR